MPVRRVVHDELGSSHIEPPFDQNWSDEDKLRWHAGVVALDTGLWIELNQQPRSRRWHRPMYGYTTKVSSGAAYDYDSMWTLLSGFDLGARTARAQAAEVTS